MTLKIQLNGKEMELSAPGDFRLSIVLQESCRGIPVTCGGKNCGKCLILLDGFPCYSCQIPFFTVRGKSITTIEGVIQESIFQDIFKGFKRAELNICDHCAPARVLSLIYLLRKNYNPSNQEIQDLIKSINCTCSSQTQLHRGIIYALEEKHRRQHG